MLCFLNLSRLKGVGHARAGSPDLPIPSLRNIQSFIAVANSLSIHLAAEQLNVTASAVSHQIASLESWMGRSYLSAAAKA